MDCWEIFINNHNFKIISVTYLPSYKNVIFVEALKKEDIFSSLKHYKYLNLYRIELIPKDKVTKIFNQNHKI